MLHNVEVEYRDPNPLASALPAGTFFLSKDFIYLKTNDLFAVQLNNGVTHIVSEYINWTVTRIFQKDDKLIITIRE